MKKSETIQVFRDKERDLEKRIIDAVGKVGPRNIAEISRLTRAHQETIRYKFKHRFGRLGLRFHAEVDYGRLGLDLHWLALSISPMYYDNAPALFRLLNKACYLNYFAKVVPGGSFVVRVAIPNGKQTEYAALMKWLKTERVLTDFSLKKVRVSRHVTMNPKFFDFRSHRWEIPWNELGAESARQLPVVEKAAKLAVDYFDLLILKELQIDSTQHMTSIARKLKVNQKTLEYHYRSHVIGQELVRSYFVKWVQDTSKTLSHSVALTRLVFRPQSSSELERVQSAVSKIPFLWEEDLMDDGTYVTGMYVPLNDMLSMLAYVNTELGELGRKVESEYVKTSEASAFTIPYEAWKDGGWSFDTDKMKSEIRNGLSKIRQK